MKILLDTNIVVDFLTAREPFAKDAKRVFELIESDEVVGYLSSSSITTIHYLSQKVFDKKRANEIVVELLAIFKITPLDKEIFYQASQSAGSDFEDSVIIQSAKKANIDIIISRDKRGFKDSIVLTLEPKEFLASLSEGSTFI